MNGIIYIAIGEDYLHQALRSAKSIIENYRSKCPDIIIYSDIKCDSLLLFNPTQIQIRSTPDWAKNLLNPVSLSAYLKTQLLRLSPFDKTLFIDTDTLAFGDISSIWACTESIALSLAFNPIEQSDTYPDGSEEHYTQKMLTISGDYTQYNTGVILFKKCSEVSKVFSNWYSQWLIFGNNDNKAFNRLVALGLKIDCLPSVYNDFYPNRSDLSIIVHYIGHYKQYL